MECITSCATPDDIESLLAERMLSMRPSLVRKLLKNAGGPDFISFAGGLPNPRFFPAEALAAAAEAVLAQRRGRCASACGERRLPTSAGVNRCALQTALRLPYPDRAHYDYQRFAGGPDLLGKVLLNPGDVVINEQPGYQGAIHPFTLRYVGSEPIRRGLIPRRPVNHPASSAAAREAGHSQRLAHASDTHARTYAPKGSADAC